MSLTISPIPLPAGAVEEAYRAGEAALGWDDVGALLRLARVVCGVRV